MSLGTSTIDAAALSVSSRFSVDVHQSTLRQQMKIVIAGGSGLIGTALTKRLLEAEPQRYEIVVLSRAGSGGGDARVKYVPWQPDGTSGPWAAALDGAHAVVNLAGAGIADQRWTPSRKTEIRMSRVLPTRSLMAALQRTSTRPAVFVQGSAVGYYGTGDGSRPVDERDPPGRDFLAEVGVEWEAAAEPAAELAGRLTILRSGVVLSSAGGALPKLKWPFLFFVGGPIGRGQQYMSWIHARDLTSFFVWAIDTPGVKGAMNATSPNPVTNAQFSRAFGRALRRPSAIPVPPVALRALYGEMAQVMLIEGQRVLPVRAVEMGFRFEYPHIEAAIADVVRRKAP
jgi:uncharacterized protein (TIGR01777 family)